MENEFIKVDLHVHTPASACYKGDKSINGYWAILQNAVKNDVKVIAITDHNTLQGYETFIRLKQETYNEYNIIKKYNIPDEDKVDLEEKLALFEKVYIVLGVEITLNPGVHIIVLCSENEKSELSDLLDEIGYTADRRGSDTDSSPNMDIKAFLNNPKLQGKIVFAPHVDSNQGIWNELSGRYREEIFSSNSINAISCNSASQLTTIRRLVTSQPGYIRKTPFAYLNASDAHREIDVGSKYSFFALSDYSFEAIERVFDAPEEKISDIDTPGFTSFINRCIESNKSVFVNDMEELPKFICATLNSGYGYVLLGIAKNKLYSGINYHEEDLKNIIESSINRLSNANQNRGYVSVSVVFEKLGNGRCACIISIRDDSHGLWILDDKEVYILDTTDSIKLATINDIVLLAKENIIDELREFNKRNDTIIKETIRKMTQVALPVSKYVLYNKLSLKSFRFGYLFDVNILKKSKTKYFDTDKISIVNGYSTGNVYYISEQNPRLEDAYLRYSCPIYRCDDEEYVSQLPQFQGPAIVVSSKGGCHIVDTNSKFYIDPQDDALVLTPKDTLKEEKISIYHIIAWLKSSFCIWACLEKTGSTNIFEPWVFNNLFFACNSDFVSNTEVESLVKDMLTKEAELLATVTQLSDDDENKFIELIQNHNAQISTFAYIIECIIQEAYQIADEDIDLMNNDLESEKVYVFHHEGDA